MNVKGTILKSWMFDYVEINDTLLNKTMNGFIIPACYMTKEIITKLELARLADILNHQLQFYKLETK